MPDISSLDPPTKIRVFVSYSRQDIETANWLRLELESHGFEVFRDIDSTLPGEEWWQRLMNLITLADTVIFLLSSRSSVSTVCGDEIEYAATLNKRVIPVVVEAVDWQAVPNGLKKIHSIDLTDHSKRDLALTQLVAAIQTNIDWIREHSRLLDRAKLWQSKGESPAELLMGTAIDEAERWLTLRPAKTDAPTTLHQQYILASREAERIEQQRLLAESEEQRRVLEKERDHAEQSFRAGLDVLTDINMRILDGFRTTAGVTLATREAVTQILLEATERLRQASPEFIPSSVQMQLTGNEMRATASLAEIFNDQGQFAKAEETAKRALKLAEEFRKDEYNPLQRRPGFRQIASLLDLLGDIKFRQQDFEEAIAFLNESISLRERCVERYTKFNADFCRDLADGLQRLAIVYLVSNQPANALNVSKRALVLIEDLFKETPDDEFLRVAVAGMLHTVGDAYFDTGSYSLAEENFKAAYDIYDDVLQKYPDNLFLIRWKSICMERFGNIKMQDGDFCAAIKIFEDTLKLKQILIDADSENVEFKQDYAIIRNKLTGATELAREMEL